MFILLLSNYNISCNIQLTKLQYNFLLVDSESENVFFPSTSNAYSYIWVNNNFSPKYEPFLENKVEEIMIGKRISGIFLDYKFLKELCFDLGDIF